MRLTQAKSNKTSMQKEIVKLETQIEHIVDRIVDTVSPAAISAYEKRIATLEQEKLIVEKLEKGTSPKRTFAQMFELALLFLSNPWKLWESYRLEDKRTVLKLTFSERLAYDRKTGFRTPKTTLPFKVLGGSDMGKKEVVPLDSETSNTIFEIFEDWSYQLERADISTLDFELEDEIEESKS